jgi:CheY-like chemotaxis protein
MSQPKLPNILIADDDPEDQELLIEAILELSPDMSVKSVWNGQEALTYLATCPDADLPCLVILDFKMPILNAAEVLEQLQDNARYLPIPKIVWSTSNQPEYINSCLEKGATGYFTKPNNPNELSIMTSKVLSLCESS